MKNCDGFDNLIEDLIDGELDPQTTERVNSHVFACPKCRNEFEKQRREKEVFAQYLFDVEPPADSWASFQKRLVTENAGFSGQAAEPATPLRQKKFGFVFGFSPAFAAAAALFIIFGIGVFWMKTSRPEAEIQNVAAGSVDSPPPLARNDAAQKTEPDAPAQIDDSAKLTSKRISPSAQRPRAAQKSAPTAKSAETADLQIESLETELAGQIEKVELLLRSFRNAREIAGAHETFDVEYERTQARKLLDANTRLRRDAETSGNIYAEEFLSRVEPYLLEIANLDARPAAEKVLEIKERVARQNIIASLQVY